MMAGGCLSGLGLVGASFCNSVEELYFCIGVVGGTYFNFFYIFKLSHDSPIFFPAHRCHLVFLKNNSTIPKK